MSDAHPPYVDQPQVPQPPAVDPTGPAADTASDQPRTASWRSWAAGTLALVVVVGAGFALRNGEADDASAAVDTSAGTDQSQATTGGQGADDTGVPTPNGFGRGVGGVVTEIDGSTLKVDSKDPSGSSEAITVSTDGDTVVVEAVVAELSALSVGDSVTVVGDDVDGSVLAERVTQSDAGLVGELPGMPEGGVPPEMRDGGAPPEMPEGGAPPEMPEGGAPPEMPDGGGRPGGAAAGTITDIDSSGFTLETRDGSTIVVQVGDETTVTVLEERDVADIEVGDTIQVTGDESDQSIHATRIRIGELGDFPGGAMPGGMPGGQRLDSGSTGGSES